MIATYVILPGCVVELARTTDGMTKAATEQFESRIVVRKEIRTLFGTFLLDTLVVADHVDLAAVHTL